MPAAAVIPAPMADVDSAAVKKLVVEFWSLRSPGLGCCSLSIPAMGNAGLLRGELVDGSNHRRGIRAFYCEEIWVLKAGFTLESFSTE